MMPLVLNLYAAIHLPRGDAFAAQGCLTIAVLNRLDPRNRPSLAFVATVYSLAKCSLGKGWDPISLMYSYTLLVRWVD